MISIDGKGKVIADPPLIAPNVVLGATITLTAVPDSGWQFSGWSGGLSGSAPTGTVTATAATSILAKFELNTGVGIVTNLPAEYTLEQNYPNPFNATTTLAFALEKEGMTTLEIYNMLGQKIRTLMQKKLPAGGHTMQLDASDLPSGIYFYQLCSGAYQATRKFILMK